MGVPVCRVFTLCGFTVAGIFSQIIILFKETYFVYIFILQNTYKISQRNRHKETLESLKMKVKRSPPMFHSQDAQTLESPIDFLEGV